MKNKKDVQSAKEKIQQIKMTTSSDTSSVSPKSDDFYNLSYEDDKSSTINDNLSHSVIPTTVMNKPKIECVDARQPHEYDANSYDGYGRNMYYSYDQSLNNNYFNNLFPANNNQFDYYNFNNDYVGPIRRHGTYQNAPKSQYIANATLNDNMFNYEGGVLYDILNDTKNDMLMVPPPNDAWVSSMLVNSPPIPTGPELINL